MKINQIFDNQKHKKTGKFLFNFKNNLQKYNNNNNKNNNNNNKNTMKKK